LSGLLYICRMTRRPLSILLALGILVSVASCDNELDVTAEYKEIGIIYSLINPGEAEHVVRIQKAFLGDGNALVMAENPDSTYYGDILDVKLIQIKNGAEITTIPLTRFTGQDKEEGDFPVSPNILYKTNGEVLDKSSEYKIVVKNLETGNEFWAQTVLVDTVKIVKPSVTNNSDIRWVIKNGNNPAEYNDVIIEYAVSSKAEIYSYTIRFNFIETNVSNGQITSKSIDWVFGNDYVFETNGAPNITHAINGEDFYRFVAQKLNPDNTVQRTAGTLDFIVSGGSEVLANYININSSTTSILTTIPLYTNVNNGLGIFASRFVTTSPNKPLGVFSLDSLKNGKYTKDLGFQ
jgi:hypothetical protein